MNYHFEPNYYSIFKPSLEINRDYAHVGVHGIFYKTCNFNCVYCNNRSHPAENYSYYSEQEFREMISKLLNKGCYFKFSGGEPTRNPNLFRDLQIVKDYGGIVLLDTNGSRPEIVQQLLENKLIDTIGISLKGLNPESALKISRINNSILCWDNVFKTIDMASRAGIKVIVTLVFHDEMGYSDLDEFAHLLSEFPNVYLKVNNLLLNQNGLSTYKPISDIALISLIEDFVMANSVWKSRIFLISNYSAIRDSEKIIYF